MANASVKRLPVDEFEGKGEGVFKALPRYRGLKESICINPKEEIEREASEEQDHSDKSSSEDDLEGETDLKSDPCTESPHSQKMKKTEPDASDLKDDAGDEEDRMSVENDENEDDDAGSDVSEGSQKSRTPKRIPRGRKMSIHVCPYENCNKFFSRPFRLAQHVRTHTGERPYVCPSESCSKSYTRQQHLKRHIEVCHQEQETKEKLECAVCNLTLSNIYCLRKHIQRHHVTREQHKCGECGQTFIKQQQLQKHTYEHTGIKPFVCDYPDCKMRFLTQSKLKRHKLTHQKSRYACPQESCEEKFDAYTDLQHHMVDDHPKVCDICDRPFRALRHLRKHRLTHESTTQAYFCTYPACDRHYANMSNLTTHIMEKHKHMKIYECGVCDKRLSTKQKLIHHMNIHNPDYTRNYTSKKPRKPRKDKGCIRRNYHRLLSGYEGPEEGEGESEEHGEGVSKELPSESVAVDDMDASSSTPPPNVNASSQDEVVMEAENESHDRELALEEF